jgi:hypothetical protein
MQMLIDLLRDVPVEDNTIDVAADGTPFPDGSIIATTETIGDFQAEWPLQS